MCHSSSSITLILMRMTSSTSQIPAESTLAGLDLVLNIIMDSILEGIQDDDDDDEGFESSLLLEDDAT